MQRQTIAMPRRLQAQFFDRQFSTSLSHNGHRDRCILSALCKMQTHRDVTISIHLCFDRSSALQAVHSPHGADQMLVQLRPMSVVALSARQGLNCAAQFGWNGMLNAQEINPAWIKLAKTKRTYHRLG